MASAVKTPRSVIVVGAGAVGLACALYARRAGLDVTIIERGPQDRDCCSLGNAGMIVPSHFVPLAAPGVVRQGLRSIGRRGSPIYIRLRTEAAFLRWSWLFMRSATARHVQASAPLLRDLSLYSRRCFEELAEEFGNPFGLEKRGLLMLCRTDAGLDEEAHTAKLAEELGLDAELLDASGVSERLPGMEVRAAGGVHYPLDCHLSPQRFVTSMEQEVERLGGQVLWQTEALGWRRSSSRVVALQTSRGDLVADEYVLATGAWSPNVTRGLALRLPVEAGKGYSLLLASPPVRPALGCILVEARIAVTPISEGVRFGGTMEIGGLNNRIDVERVRAMTAAVPEYFPQFRPSDFESSTPWQGLRPISPDGLPYLGRVRSLDNFIVATGHAMLGLSLAPATGRIVSDLLTGMEPAFPLAALQPERFS